MKQTILLLSALFTFNFCFSQSPKLFSYQSVIRDNSNTLVSNMAINIKVSMLQSTSTGSVVYSETHNTTTNFNGLVSIMIGNGTLLSGNFNSINF